MRKPVKILLLIVAGLVALIGLFAAFVALKGIPTYEPEKATVKIDYTPQRVANGEKLAAMLCQSCHYDERSQKFTGKELTEVTQFGTIYSKNITRDPNVGVANWTDGELVSFIRTGVRPDGQYVPPYMPKLVNISDEDLYSIISFLRSDHKWVQPDGAEPPESKPSFLTKFLCTVAFKPFPLPKQPIAEPDTTDPVKHGRYIALHQLECFSCHSEDFAKNDYFQPEKSPGFFGGGNKLFDRAGNAVYSQNITMDEKTGIGKWTEAQFVNAVKNGILPDGSAVQYPMQPYHMLTDKEIHAIYAYLKTVPKIENEVERKVAGSRNLSSTRK
jgi:mono/diheme cytochrome c family protein